MNLECNPCGVIEKKLRDIYDHIYDQISMSWYLSSHKCSHLSHEVWFHNIHFSMSASSQLKLFTSSITISWSASLSMVSSCKANTSLWEQAELTLSGLSSLKLSRGGLGAELVLRCSKSTCAFVWRSVAQRRCPVAGLGLGWCTC